ncbi:MAG: GYD domain-containing protein [Chloroflexi bacterium]|nr:GYD domain-containing protein [Chloroflexota bacterium]
MTAQTWAALLANPENRLEVARAEEAPFGCRVQGYWYGLDGHDVYTLQEAPDEVAIATLLARLKASGGFSHVTTTLLLTVDQMLDAVRQANNLAYSPPGGAPA